MERPDELDKQASQLEQEASSLEQVHLPIDSQLKSQQAQSLRAEAIELRQIQGQKQLPSTQPVKACTIVMAIS